LNVIELEIPPLRARIDDIPVLAQHFLERIRQETNKPVAGINQQAINALKNYPWPGNVRELENAVERAVVLAKGHHLTKDDFAFLFRSSPQDILDVKRTRNDRADSHSPWVEHLQSSGTLEISRVTPTARWNITILELLSTGLVACKVELQRKSVR
jgi:two-component system response regulator HydG